MHCVNRKALAILFASDDPFRSDLQVTCRDRSLEIIRQGSFKAFPFTGARMMKAELPCVQHLAAKIFGESRRVDFVTQDRMTKMMQMHPNLMCAASVKFAFNQTPRFVRRKKGE